MALSSVMSPACPLVTVLRLLCHFSYLQIVGWNFLCPPGVECLYRLFYNGELFANVRTRAEEGSQEDYPLLLF
jgi:hypothetical protein